MFALYSFGSQLEDRRGSRFLLLLVLGSGDFVERGAGDRGQRAGARGRLFGGCRASSMACSAILPRKFVLTTAIAISSAPARAFIAMLWFTLCILRDIPPFDSLLKDAIPPIANTAHAVGLIVGVVVAYAPLLCGSRRKLLIRRDH